MWDGAPLGDRYDSLSRASRSTDASRGTKRNRWRCPPLHATSLILNLSWSEGSRLVACWVNPHFNRVEALTAPNVLHDAPLQSLRVPCAAPGVLYDEGLFDRAFGDPQRLGLFRRPVADEKLNGYSTGWNEHPNQKRKRRYGLHKRMAILFADALFLEHLPLCVIHTVFASSSLSVYTFRSVLTASSPVCARDRAQAG